MSQRHVENSETELPQPPTLPPAVREAIHNALGVASIQVGPFPDGGNQRTFLITDGTREWVARFEHADGLQLKRIFHAQSLARMSGARVPELVAWDLDAAGSDRFLWIVEQRVPGVPFDHRHYDRDAVRAIAADTGAQFRCLASASLERWGSLLPRPDPGPASYRAMIEGWEPGVERAFRAAGIDTGWLPVVREVWALLCNTAPSTPCLCHGDPAGSNVLVEPSLTVTLVDWEWAGSGDPASMVAYWSFWHDGPDLLEALLEGYQPEDRRGFRQRVLASQVPTAINTIHVYGETPDPEDPTQGVYADPAGIVFAGQKLEGYLRERAWER